ncbi:uncharacterized protein LOC130053241 [Ostrea edulis]|uniref:uncharacterized protein LOC130053241 n=1 Tax=Ostrea edulis TaxID=37623 RepID=UPI0024AF07CC|nr:uncharacterized protein LOC130053241 [Ostrea edulis]
MELRIFCIVFCVGVCFSQTHTNDHQKISDLQTEFDRLKSEFEDYKNRSMAEIRQLRGESSFLSTVQTTNVRTLNSLMTDVFEVKAKLSFITMDSVHLNSSLDVVLEAIKSINKLNHSIEDVAGKLRNRSKCQRGSQYVRKCSSPNWDVAQCGNVTVRVDFSPVFNSVPYVMFGVSKLDAEQSHNTRFQAFASDISKTGFNYHIGTWGDSELWGSTFEWLSCPY